MVCFFTYFTHDCIQSPSNALEACLSHRKSTVETSQMHWALMFTYICIHAQNDIVNMKALEMENEMS